MELEMNIWTIIVTVFLLVGLTLLFFRADIWHYLRKIVRDEAMEDIDVAGTMALSGTGTNHEQGNFFRMCILIVDYGLKILQDVLCKELESEYPNLFKSSTGLLHKVLGDKEVKKNLNKLSPKVFFQDQRNQLYPAGSPSTSVTVGDLDVTLTVLLLRNITQLKHSPRHAWDNPSDIDTSKAAAIGRIKKYRNSVYAHANKTAITDTDFKEYFQGLKSNLQTLSSRFTDEDYDDILSRPLDDALFKEYQKLLEEWYKYDQDVKDLLMTVKSRVEELPQQMWGMMNYFMEKFAQKLEDQSFRLSKWHTTKADPPHVTKPDTTRQSPVMSPTHKNLLVQMAPILKENLQIEDIMLDMVDRGIYSEQDAEKVKACKIDRDKADEFLRILPKCGPRAFETFVRVLTNHNKKELADLLADKAIACSSKNQIASFYIKWMSQIQRLPWDPDDTMHIDNVYVNLQWVQEERKPAGTSSVPIKRYTSIFKDNNQGERSKRILVKGKAGIGKTTFTQKMATDWANATLGLGECDEVFSKYKHLLILNLRNIQPGQTLKEAIETQITCSVENREAVTDEIMQAIDFDTDHVLLVFDGYDEYDPNTSKEITDTILVKRYKDVCTIITTRPWKAQELMNGRIMDDVYEITGLKRDNIAEYVAKFFGDTQTYKKYQEMGSDDTYQRGVVLRSIGMGLVGHLRQRKLMPLVKIPIFLLFICLMWEENPTSDTTAYSLPGSYTLLYEKLLRLIIRRKNKIEKESEVDKYFEELNDTFLHLGERALHGLLKPGGNLIFDEEDLQSIPHISELYRLGLLSRSKVHCNFDVKQEVTFLHKTIQELLAAKYLARTTNKNNNDLDEFLQCLNTLLMLRDMEYVLLFLCGLSQTATAKVLHRAKMLKYSLRRPKLNNLIYCDLVNGVWVNNLLLEHWYAHCPNRRVLPPELIISAISCHTELHIPASFEHSDPRFQQALWDSVGSAFSSPQTCAVTLTDVKKVKVCSKYNIDMITRKNLKPRRDFLPILNMCGFCECAMNNVLSKAPNLQSLEIKDYCEGGLASISNPGNLVHLQAKNINGQDFQVIQQMVSLKYISVGRYRIPQNPVPLLGTLPNISHDLAHIEIIDIRLGDEGVKSLGRNLRHVLRLEYLGLDNVFSRRPECGPSRCTCPEGKDTQYDRCQDVCEAVRELSQGVIYTTKLTCFSFESNHLGQYSNIASPLKELVQSLSTVSKQTRMTIEMYGNDLDKVNPIDDLKEAIVSSYQHISAWYLLDNGLEESLPQPDGSLKCKVKLTLI